ncbi:YkgJ family cysteine cluster protein [Pyrofollis japonicus]|uniref:YkgJ family cysteine cluster protein n=1 Tax=Pyrofollis japonicus TaxID=3060460 RepID=UPI00295AC2EC|nr:YkgJ family cysteine cluster protein [Pyrofollis japonicus]
MTRPLMKRFECLFCEHCCYFEDPIEMPTVFAWEKRLLEELAEARGIRLEFEPIQIFRDKNGICVVTLYRWIIRGFCPFYDRETKKCTIHEKKPYACKMYPLLLEMPSGRLMVSGKCDWVKRNKDIIDRLMSKPDFIPKVFPNEFKAATNAFIEFSSISEYVSSKDFSKVTDLKDCKKVMDIDEYIARYG